MKYKFLKVYSIDKKSIVNANQVEQPHTSFKRKEEFYNLHG